jgi:hypothetical protein
MRTNVQMYCSRCCCNTTWTLKENLNPVQYRVGFVIMLVLTFSILYLIALAVYLHTFNVLPTSKAHIISLLVAGGITLLAAQFVRQLMWKEYYRCDSCTAWLASTDVCQACKEAGTIVVDDTTGQWFGDYPPLKTIPCENCEGKGRVPKGTLQGTPQ